MTKHKKYRANVKSFVDSDYKHKLSKEDKEYLEKFEGEYYANELNRQGSIHRESLSEEDFNIAKKVTYDATNAQNRCSYAISATGSYLCFIESEQFYGELVTPLKKSLDVIDPQTAFNILLSEVIDEIKSDTGRDLDVILTEMSIELVKLGASITHQRTQKILKKRREKSNNNKEK